MRTKDIEVGKTYNLRLSEEQSLIYQGCDVVARVLRAGFHYEVRYSTGSAVRGAPFVTYRQSEHPNGVEVEWERQEVWSNRRHRNREYVGAGRAIVNARAVEFEIEPPKVVTTESIAGTQDWDAETGRPV
jgi:hypothetical protein